MKDLGFYVQTIHPTASNPSRFVGGKVMKRLLWGLLAVFAVFCVYAPTAKASGVGSIGCGPGSGSTLVTTCTGTISNTGSLYMTSTAIDVSLTGLTCVSHCGFLSNPVIAADLAINGEVWDFSFTATNGSTGTFMITDSGGVGGGPDFELSGAITLLTVTPGTGGTSTLTLDIDPTLVGFGYKAGSGGPAGLYTSSVSGYSGTVTIMDPGNAVTGLTGTVNYANVPTPTSSTPEPGTLLLLGTGLLGFAVPIRRRLVRA